MGFLDIELAADDIGDLRLLEDAPYPISVGDRVRRSHGDLSLGEVAGTVTRLGSDPADGVVTHDISWDDGSTASAVRGSDIRCVTVLEAATQLSNTSRRPGESLTSWGKRLQAGDAALAAKAKTRTGGKPKAPGGAGYDEAKHPRGRGGKWTVGAGATGAEVRGVQRRVGAKVDGQFGGMTKAAVMSYQRRHGLQVDGVVGAQTVAALRGRRQKAKVGKLTAADMKWLAGNKQR